MKIHYRSNLSAGCLAIAVGLILFFVIPGQVGLESQSVHGITSRTLPYALAILIMGSGIGLLVQSLILKKDKTKELDLKKEGIGVIYMICLLAYGIGFSYSFVISTALLGCVTLAFRKCKKVSYYVIVLVVTMSLYAVFTQFLHVQLP